MILREEEKKKRLSLLLVMVMALTMVIGTGVCAWADDTSVVIAECGDSEHHYLSHFYSYGTLNPEGEMCSCGAVRNTQPISAMAYALYDYATPMINTAKSGQTITFEFGEWNSFPKSFMAKLVDKSAQNVTFVFHYKWNHQKQEITIPAGTPIDLNFDWYGLAKMAELYGMY